MDDAASAATAKHEAIRSREIDFVALVTEELSHLPATAEASADPQAQYVAALRTVARISALCEQYRDLIAFTARREPNPLSIARIADATSLSVNTVRTKLPSIKQGRTVEYDKPPF